MTHPVRLQLSRRKGFDLQALSQATNSLPAVTVARPSKWGNPFTIAGYFNSGRKGTPRQAALTCVDAFRAWMTGERHWAHAIPMKASPDANDLRGKNLACWCKPGEPCHADVLLDLANCEEVPE